jgi:hypothetical protein
MICYKPFDEMKTPHNKRMQSDKLLRYASQFAADAGR